MTRIDLTDSPVETPQKQERSLGELVADAAGEMSTLVRQEVALAKAELSQSVKSAGMGVGAFGGAGVTVLVALLFGSLAAMFGLEAAGLPIGLAALAVAGFWLLVTLVLAMVGKNKLSHVGGVPRTTKTIKEDVAWARHPTS